MCPPGTDQTTRTSQRWHILALRRKEKGRTKGPRSWSGSQHAMCPSHSPGWDLIDKLLVTDDAECPDPHLLLLQLPTPQHNLSRIEQLPAEVLATILSDARLDVTDVLAFGLCSLTLWHHALEQMRQTARKGLWAGEPLIHTGSWLTHLPPAIHSIYPNLKAEEQAFFRNIETLRPSDGKPPARRWESDAVRCFTAYPKFDLGERCLTYFASSAENGSIGTTQAYVAQQSLSEIVNTLAIRRNSTTSWVLRNLTLRKYVKIQCCYDAQKKCLLASVAGYPWLPLEMALMSKITWASSGPRDEERIRSGGLNHLCGEWAGHCFDVVSPSTLDQTYRDVTDEFAQWALTFRHLLSAYPLNKEGHCCCRMPVTAQEVESD